jgi:hypothetical protein
MKKLILILLIISFSSCNKDPNFYNLKTISNPIDGGTVNPNYGTYLDGEIVNIKATPNDDFVLKSWGSTTDNSISKNILMNSNKTVVANFIKSPNNELLEFSFLKSNNPNLNEDIHFEIKGNIVHAYSEDFVDPRNLIASFKHTAKFIRTNLSEQISGISINNFNNIVNYELIAANGDKNVYEINFKSFTDLPVILIKTDDKKEINSKDEYVKGNLTFIGRDFENSEFTKSIKIRGRGHFTWKQPKKPYQLKFKDKTAFFDMKKDKKWIFLANYADKTMTRTAITQKLGHISNLEWTPSSYFSEVFINGRYNGTYQISEKIEEDNHRVNVGKNGFLIEIDQLVRMTNNDVFVEGYENLYNIKYPETYINSDEYNYFKNFILNFEKKLFSDEFKDPVNGYRNLIDLESLVDWYLINEINKNGDKILKTGAFFSSVFITLKPDGKIKFGPLWDYDLAFGNITSDNNDKPNGFWLKDYSSWFKQMFKDQYFVEMVKKRFLYFYSNRNEIIDFSNKLSKKLTKSRIENEKVWKTLGKSNAPGLPVGFNTFEEEQNHLNNWIIIRFEWLRNEIDKL